MTSCIQRNVFGHEIRRRSFFEELDKDFKDAEVSITNNVAVADIRAISDGEKALFSGGKRERETAPAESVDKVRSCR